MPYNRVADLPEHVRSLPAKSQRQWMHVWNSSYEACMRDEFGSAKKCESQAFAKANGVVKGSELDDQYVYDEGAFRLFVESQAFSSTTISDGWFPFLPTPGKYKHPVYGEVDITPEGNQALVDSVKNGIYQDHIPIDAEHKTKLSGAVAWLTDMRMNADGSADANLRWTARGRTLMEGGQFRYISPEFFGQWPDPATGVIHKNVVAGGAITTRPFFKDKSLRALVASESGAEVIDASYWFRDFTREQRDKLASSGAAMPDGSFPIENAGDLENAINDFGRAGSRPEVKAHIKKRARALGKTDLLPESWSEEFAMSKCPDCGAEVPAGTKTCPDCGAKLMTEPTKGKGEGEPRSITMTEAELTSFVEDKIKAATDEQKRVFDEKIADLNTKAEAAEATAASEHDAREALAAQLKARDDADRQRRFTDLVAGKGGSNDGAPFAGDPEKQVTILTKMAETFGEDSEEFTAYVEQQVEVAKKLNETVMREYGTSGRTAPSDPEQKIEAMAQKRMSEDSKLSHAQAYAEVLDSDEGRALYEQIS